jgi:uncharacterized paraquat-inducible protein A
MTIGRRHILILISLAFVGVNIFFSVTDTAWELMGRPNEAYPELMFLVFGLPISLALLIFAITRKG